MDQEKNPWEMENKVCLNLGCGIETKKGFINVDKFYTWEQLNSKEGIFAGAILNSDNYIQADILHLPFEDNSVDYVELFNVIEHFPMREVVNYLKEIYRVIKPGGKFLCMTNNMDGLAIDWLQLSTRNFNLENYYYVAETIYGNQYAEGETHKCPFTPTFFYAVMRDAGFVNGKVFESYKNTVVHAFGSVEANPKAVYRNDLLFVEAIK